MNRPATIPREEQVRAAALTTIDQDEWVGTQWVNAAGSRYVANFAFALASRAFITASCFDVDVVPHTWQIMIVTAGTCRTGTLYGDTMVDPDSNTNAWTDLPGPLDVEGSPAVALLLLTGTTSTQPDATPSGLRVRCTIDPELAIATVPKQFQAGLTETVAGLPDAQLVASVQLNGETIADVQTQVTPDYIDQIVLHRPSTHLPWNPMLTPADGRALLRGAGAWKTWSERPTSG